MKKQTNRRLTGAEHLTGEARKAYLQGYRAAEARIRRLAAQKANEPTVIHFTTREITRMADRREPGGNAGPAGLIQILKEYDIPKKFHKDIVREAFGHHYILYDVIDDLNLFRLDGKQFGDYLFKVTFG